MRYFYSSFLNIIWADRPFKNFGHHTCFISRQWVIECASAPTMLMSNYYLRRLTNILMGRPAAIYSHSPQRWCVMKNVSFAWRVNAVDVSLFSTKKFVDASRNWTVLSRGLSGQPRTNEFPRKTFQVLLPSVSTFWRQRYLRFSLMCSSNVNRLSISKKWKNLSMSTQF